MQTSKIFKTAMLTIAVICLSSCEKPAGPGGRASIQGRVFAHDFENTQRVEISQTYAAGERVFIMYGNSNTVGDDVRTAPDGTFEFRYLTKGHYRIFVNSLDTSIKRKGNDTEIPVFRDVDITETKQNVMLEDIIINR